MRGDKLAEQQISGWRAVSAAGLHGQGPDTRRALLMDTGMIVSAMTSHDSRLTSCACHPCAGAMLIFSASLQV